MLDLRASCQERSEHLRIQETLKQSTESPFAAHLLSHRLVNMISNLSRKKQPKKNCADDESHYANRIKNNLASVVGESALNRNSNNPHGVTKPSPNAKRD